MSVASPTADGALVHARCAERRVAAASAWPFAACTLAVAAAACGLAGWLPLGFSIVTVFLFAGPHNWCEARYFLSRMPARWGPLAKFFATGIAGVVALTAAYAAMPSVASALDFGADEWLTAQAAWNTALIGWVLVLVLLRCRQNPRREWPLAVPIAAMLVAPAWLWPAEWGLALVYAHPLVALVFLDRELGRTRPEWRGAFRACLLAVPAALLCLAWRLAAAPDLPGDDGLSLRITNHAGANVLTEVSSHLLVACHTFLEMLHYGVWLVAIPLVTWKTAPWKVGQVPLGRRSHLWRIALAGVLTAGAAAVVILWAGFLADYPLTRDVYFTVAVAHVLAEVPFLLRLL